MQLKSFFFCFCVTKNSYFFQVPGYKFELGTSAMAWARVKDKFMPYFLQPTVSGRETFFWQKKRKNWTKSNFSHNPIHFKYHYKNIQLYKVKNLSCREFHQLSFPSYELQVKIPSLYSLFHLNQKQLFYMHFHKSSFSRENFLNLSCKIKFISV